MHWRHVAGSTIHPLHDSFGMLADVYRSRLGLVAPASLTAVFVREPDGRRPDPGIVPLIESTLAPVNGGAPLPVLVLDSAVVVLLALVPPAGTSAVLDALRGAVPPLEVSARPMSARTLRALGPLHTRLQPASPHGGQVGDE